MFILFKLFILLMYPSSARPEREKIESVLNRIESGSDLLSLVAARKVARTATSILKSQKSYIPIWKAESQYGIFILEFVKDFR